MLQDQNLQDESSPSAPPTRDVQRRGAVGKALLVWLATGSVGAALVAFLVFKGMGC